MKRISVLALALALTFIPAAALAADEKGGAGGEVHGEAEGDEMIVWRWANFVVLAAVLAYFGAKFGKPYFRARHEEISRDLETARRQRADAELRSSQVRARLANLDSEIEALRRSVQEEQTAEIERRRLRVEAEAERIRASARQQIEFFSKTARLELQRHASRLALELAEQRLRSSMSPAAQHSLVESFVQEMGA